VAVIPARGGSQRLPRKNTISLRGAPLIAYTIHAALAAKCFEAVLVSSEDAELLAIARAHGAGVVERPLEMACDTAPIDEALRHALAACRNDLALAPDVLVWLQADVPIRDAGAIDRAVDMLRGDPETSAVATGFAVSQHPAWMKITDAEGYIRPLDSTAKKFRAQDLPPRYLLDGAVVALRVENLEGYDPNEGLHLYLGARPRLLLQEHPRFSLNVESAEHLDLAAFYLERYPEHRLP
jgi:N-acylneuraminate cytidylyltransferase